MPTTLQGVLRRVGRRDLAQRSLLHATAGLLAGLAIALLLLVADRTIPLAVPPLVYAAPPLLGLAAGFGATLVGGPRRLELARRLDRVCGLRDRLGSAVALGQPRPTSRFDPAFSRLVRHQADHAAGRLDVRHATPIRVPRRSIAAIALIVALAAGVRYLPARTVAPDAPDDVAFAASEEPVAREALAEELATTIDDLEETLEPDETPSTLDALTALEEQLRAPDDTAPDAEAARDETVARLHDLADELEQAADEDAATRDALAERFTGLEGTTPPDAADAFTRALERGDFEEAADRLDEILDGAERLPADERRAIAEHLRQLRDAMRREPAQAPDQLPDHAPSDREAALRDALHDQGLDEEAIDELFDTANDQIEDALTDEGVDERVAEDLARDLESAREERAAEERVAEEAERLADALEEAAERAERPEAPEPEPTPPDRTPEQEPREPQTEQTDAPKPGEQQTGEPKPGEQQNGEPRPGEQQTGEPKPGEQQTGEPKPGEQQNGEPKPGEQQNGEPKPGEQQNGEPKPGEQQTGEPKPGEQQNGEPKPGEPQTGEPKPGEQQTGEPKPGEQQTGEPKPGEQQTGEPKPGEPQNGEPKPGEQQNGEPKPGEQQTGEPKPGEQQTGEPKPGEQQNGEPKPGEQQTGEPKPGEQPSDNQRSGEQPGASEERTPSDAFRDVGRRARRTEDRRSAAERARETARRLVGDEGGDAPPVPEGIEPGRGDAPSRPSDPSRLADSADDVVDAGGEEPGSRSVMEWQSDEPPVEGVPQSGAPSSEQVRRAQRTAERAIESRSVPTRYHEFIRRYFQRLGKPANDAGTAGDGTGGS